MSLTDQDTLLESDTRPRAADRSRLAARLGQDEPKSDRRAELLRLWGALSDEGRQAVLSAARASARREGLIGPADRPSSDADSPPASSASP